MVRLGFSMAVKVKALLTRTDTEIRSVFNILMYQRLTGRMGLGPI